MFHFFCLLLCYPCSLLGSFRPSITIQSILDENTTYWLNISLMHYRTEYRHQIQLLSFYQLHCFSHVFFSSNCRTFMIQDHDHFMSWTANHLWSIIYQVPVTLLRKTFKWGSLFYSSTRLCTRGKKNYLYLCYPNEIIYQELQLLKEKRILSKTTLTNVNFWHATFWSP